MGTEIATVAIQNLPGILGFLKSMFAAANPNAPAMTDDQAKAALLSALASSIAIDEAWLAAHPKA